LFRQDSALWSGLLSKHRRKQTGVIVITVFIEQSGEKQWEPDVGDLLTAEGD